jgi:hypothetical protein
MGSTGLDGGCSSASGGVSGVGGGSSTGASFGGFTFGFRAALGIKNNGYYWLEFCSLTTLGSLSFILDGPLLEKFKMDLSTGRFEESPQTRQGNFSSQLAFSLLIRAAMSNGIYLSSIFHLVSQNHTLSQKMTPGLV